MDKKLAILIPAHDSHKDVVALFLKSIEKYYPECPYEIVWTNCGTEMPGHDVKIITNDSNASFCKRLKKALLKIDAEFVWLWIEDYIPSKQIKQKNIESDLAFMVQKKCNVCRIFKANKKFMKRDKKYGYLYHINKNMPYGIALNTGIFRREFLLELIQNENWTVWELEGYCLKLASESKLQNCIYDNRKNGDIVHLLYKGKMFRNSESKLKRADLNVLDINRGYLSIKESLRVAVISFIGHRCPLELRQRLKGLAKKIGLRIASDY